MAVNPRRAVFVISVQRLSDLLRRAHAGEDPDLLILSEYANAAHDNQPSGGE